MSARPGHNAVPGLQGFQPTVMQPEMRASAPPPDSTDNPPMTKAQARDRLPGAWWNDSDTTAPQTPWGPAQSEYELGSGISKFGTAGHGGFRVPSELRGLIPAKLRASAEQTMPTERGVRSGWYEEDCDWAVAAYFLHERLSPAAQVLYPKDQLLETIRRWNGEAFAEWEAAQ